MTAYNYKRFSTSNYDYGSFSGPTPGEEMLDFTLRSLDGEEAKLTDFKGQWLVLETGSLTCPMYVKNINPIKRVVQKYPDVQFLVIYIREAHPGTRRGPHQTMGEKISVAREMQQEYGEARRVLVDDLDGSMHQAYGSFPNMVYVINPKGEVVYRCDWAYSHLIDKVLRDRPKLNFVERKRIITAVPWIMVPVTLKGGWDALWDILIALPAILWGHLKVDISSIFRKQSS